ncbi:uncharacterized protein LOC141583790 [Saimiri boliviensis]|uniref:uncharacterized protein LOC141583790 n=1 Tax=Saimiri boliviensis TaxID=27679 RepID=UPI003D78B227
MLLVPPAEWKEDVQVAYESRTLAPTSRSGITRTLQGTTATTFRLLGKSKWFPESLSIYSKKLKEVLRRSEKKLTAERDFQKTVWTGFRAAVCERLCEILNCWRN